jgi:Tol biopolymer transport system component
MNGSTVNTSTFTLTVGGMPVDLSAVVYDDASRTATLVPAADLVTATEYSAVISSTVENAVGENPLSSDYTWSFTISPITALVSKDSNAVVGNDVSAQSAIDASGRYIVFESEATNLAGAFTTLNRRHIYRKDTVSGEVVLVSSDAAGLEANNDSASPRISDDGRYVVFESQATNLSSIATGGTLQVYLKDLADGSVDLVSSALGVVANNLSENPDVSNDGRYVVFESLATNLTALDTVGASQIYLKDLSNAAIAMISQNTTQSAGGSGDSNRPSMSADARFIVFDSIAGDSLVPLATTIRSVYLVDTMSPNTTELISVDTNEIQGNGPSTNPSISDDGNFVAFESGATNLVAGGTTFSDIYRRDRFSGETLLVSTADGLTSGDHDSVGASISSDGRFVAFVSAATNLVTETSLVLDDIFVRNFATMPTVSLRKINLTPTGAEAGDNSANASISADGRYVSFDSPYNYDIGDTNTINDVYRSWNSTY